MKDPRVLIVEDEFITAMDLQVHLENLGYRVSGKVNSAEEALALLRKQPFDVILMDIMLKGEMTGIEAASRIRSDYRIPVIYLTANTDPQLLAQAKTAEPFGFLIKPFHKKELQANIEMALYKHGMEEKLRKSEEKYRRVVEYANEAITVSQDGFLKFVNPKTLEITGYSQEQLLSTPFLNFIHPDDAEFVGEQYRRRLLGEELPEAYSMRIIHQNGDIKWLEIRAILFEWDGRPATLTFLTDITERKQAEIEREQAERALESYKEHLEELVTERTTELEQEIHERMRIEESLKQAKEKALESQRLAESANLAKSAFVANMSHELRTPLNGVLGYAQILQHDARLNQEQQVQIEIIRNSGEQLLTLLNDILDLSKLEADKLEIEETAFNLSEILKPLIRILQLQTQQKGLRFEYEEDSDLLYAFHGDAMRLRQVLFNLLGNAVKFTEKGMVTFRVRRLAVEPAADLAEPYSSQVTICFEVEDTGVGIPAEQMEKIFMPFEQYSGTRLYTEGPGLGLTLCQRLLHLMGSTLKVKSIPGQGSLFSFELVLPELKKKGFTLETDILEDIQQAAGLLVAPPRESLEKLDYLALIGDIMEIRKLIEGLTSANPQIEPFAHLVLSFVETLKINKIRQLAQFYLNEDV